MSQPESQTSTHVLKPTPFKGSVEGSKKFFIKTFGCQMNVSDSERMSALLAEQGLESTPAVSEADLILINGCTVREKAVHKAVSALGRFQDLKAKKGTLIGVGGCVGQLEKEELFKKAPYLDFVFGTDTIDQLPEILSRVENGEKHVVYAQFDKANDFSIETKIHHSTSQAYVNIMKGCDKFCTYCIVPFTRGREKSRTIQEILDDLAQLVAKGVKEITLLGQNVNSFGKGNPNTQNREPKELHNPIGKVGPKLGDENFPQLLRAIDADPRLENLKRLRFTSSHPLDFSDELIECYQPKEKGGVAKLTKQLHLPVQSGSNRVLTKMGRHHQIESYISQMKRLREIALDVGISTDLIVGFPTETEEDFQKTLELLDIIQYDNIFAFAYSPRPGTRAFKLPDDVSDEIKNERLNRLLQHQLRISEKTYQARIGKEMEILVENESKNQNLAQNYAKNEKGESRKVWMGRTTCNRVVNFATKSPRNFKGHFVDVKITGATSLSLQAEMLGEAAL